MEVVGIGAATLDDLWLVPEFSAQECVSQAVQHIQMGGGPVATALCVLGCLGRSTGLIDCVGDDASGHAIVEGLLSNGVSAEGLHTIPGARSASAVILVRQQDGARQIHYLPSTAGDLKLDSAHLQLIQKARLLHINGRHEDAAREAIQAAKAKGVLVSFDGGAGRYRDSIRDLVLQSEVRILSREFASRFCGCDDLDHLFKELLTPPAQVLVITDGIDGSHVALPGGHRFHQPAYSAATLVDTTGCGDVYHGAFLHGWLEGWSAEQCADFASRIAAQNAEGLGGRWVCPSLLDHARQGLADR
ncbi:sugar/nucleoside kinase (ribokinase family) [Prosthecobacter fusiformis]|uniref:Sugar/nucleoside kinase (Ribokinase family) n=2 Tax=Prosthecobacter fusiformis TaxID=48464 RepID=A0A4R7RXM2_9BACT|nr:sugar/nucleoside kinase (ribokinase family) [Prosthecobacter fusiformis]